MKRSDPFSSPLGFILFLLLSSFLAIYIWKDRGLVFSPGQLTDIHRDGVTMQGFSSHADFEKQCSLCHVPLDTTIGELCLDCHTEIDSQVDGGTGIHGRIANVRSCQNCHLEHRGRDFDPTLAATQYFDHSVTDFSLLHHQLDYDSTPMACTDCHQPNDYAAVSVVSCQECHGGYDPEFIQAHRRDYGETCLGCHDGADRMADFDHNTTAFTLDGQHIPLVCTKCHVMGQLENTPAACEGCHTEPEVHRGLFEPTCSSCHNTQGWSPAIIDGSPFDHYLTTGFSLIRHPEDYAREAIQCSTCHPDSLDSLDLSKCVDCHTQADAVFMADHEQQFGLDCLSCHDGVDRMSEFDHALVFPLDGRHLEIACVDCHLNQVFVGTPNLCVQCHAEPEIHAGVFGLECQNCHITMAWTPATLLEHSFPLDHGVDNGEQLTDCETCHATSYVVYTCYGCHEHQQADIVQEHREEGISAADLPACVNCHPNGLEDEAEN